MHTKSLFDSLTTGGITMSNEEFIEYILDGIGHEYKEFITSLHLRPKLTFDEFFDLVVQEEQLLKWMNSMSLSTGVALSTDRFSTDDNHNQCPRSQGYKSSGRGHR